MSQIKFILVVVDRSERAHAVFAKACILARHLGARLELFICDAERAYALRHSYDQTDIHRAISSIVVDNKRYLDALLSSAGATDLDIRVNASCESPQYEGVVHEIQATQPDLVVKALMSASDQQNGWPGDNDWHLVRTCPVPLLLTRGRVWRSMPRVAAFLDSTPHESPGLSQRIAETALALCASINGSLDIVHADRPIDDAQSRAQIDALARALGIPPERRHLIPGESVNSLSQFAQTQHYDVIALGALNHSGGSTSLVGTLTDRLIHALDSDFLLLKPDSFVCPVQLKAG